MIAVWQKILPHNHSAKPEGLPEMHLPLDQLL